MIVGNTLKEFILLNYDQEQLFAKYMGLPIAEITECILDRAYKITNPLRIDKNPSLGFYYDSKNKLRCWDYAVSIYRFDIFDLVGYLINTDSNNATGFVKICNTIIRGTTFNVTKKEISVIIDLIEDDFYNEKQWKLFLGDVKASETKIK